jgi:phosphinothricin acetyltransferase
MTESDWPMVRTIYEQGIKTGNATFEMEVPSWKEWNTQHLVACRLVAKMQRAVVGWAALTPTSGRCAYGGVAEVSVYVAGPAQGQGVGKALLRALVAESERAGIWTLQAGIFPENVVSLALHERCGFRTVGVRERLGQMDGVWRDVVLLERRSRIVGI